MREPALALERCSNGRCTVATQQPHGRAVSARQRTQLHRGTVALDRAARERADVGVSPRAVLGQLGRTRVEERVRQCGGAELRRRIVTRPRRRSRRRCRPSAPRATRRTARVCRTRVQAGRRVAPAPRQPRGIMTPSAGRRAGASVRPCRSGPRPRVIGCGSSVATVRRLDRSPSRSRADFIGSDRAHLLEDPVGVAEREARGLSVPSSSAWAKIESRCTPGRRRTDLPLELGGSRRPLRSRQRRPELGSSSATVALSRRAHSIRRVWPPSVGGRSSRRLRSAIRRSRTSRASGAPESLPSSTAASTASADGSRSFATSRSAGLVGHRGGLASSAGALTTTRARPP